LLTGKNKKVRSFQEQQQQKSGGIFSFLVLSIPAGMEWQ